jgi:hypothetical protein
MASADVIQAAIEDGEVLTVIYHGGSQAGAVRLLFPRKIDGDMVRAICLASNRVKSFSLAKIDILPPSFDTDFDYVASDVASDVRLPEPKSLAEAFAPYVDTLTKKQWHLLLEDRAAGLFRSKKNGELLKSPDIFLLWCEFDELMPPDMGSVHERYPHYWHTRDRAFVDEAALIKRVRPFFVRGALGGRSYKSLLHAVAYFMQGAFSINQ